MVDYFLGTKLLSIHQLMSLTLLVLITLHLPSTSATPLTGMRILGDGEELPIGDIFGIYITPLLESDYYDPSMDFFDGEWSEGGLVLGVPTNHEVPTGSGHAFIVAKILGFDEFEDFAGWIYTNYNNFKGRGRFVATFLKNTVNDQTVVNSYGDILNSIHVSPFHSFKGFGQLNGERYMNWLSQNEKEYLWEGGDRLRVLGTGPTVAHLICDNPMIQQITLCNANLPIALYGDDMSLVGTGITPPRYWHTILELMEEWRSTAYFTLHDLSSPVFRWNHEGNGALTTHNTYWPIINDIYLSIGPKIIAMNQQAFQRAFNNMEAPYQIMRGMIDPRARFRDRMNNR